MSTITFHASAVFHVRDGYTGTAMKPGGFRYLLDGRPFVPVTKYEGYVVLLNLSPGPHSLTVICRGYLDEQVDFVANEGTLELEVTMKPGRGYRFLQTVTRLTVVLTEKGAPAPNHRLWMAYAAGPEIKLAQPKTEVGDTSARLFTKYPDIVSVPAAYLVEDGKVSEITLLRALEGETGTFAAPLERVHARGKRLLPAQSYHTGDDGCFSAVFRASCQVILFDAARGILAEAELKDGENRMEAELK